MGEGIIGMAAARCAPIRLGNLRQMARYSRTVRQSYEDEGHIGPGHEIPVPGLPDAESRVAVPAMALGQLVGVLVVESNRPVAFTSTDEALLDGRRVRSSPTPSKWAEPRSGRRRPRLRVEAHEPAVQRSDDARRRMCASSPSTAARSSTATI